MLSYQHQYHSGNFADVHKHVVLGLLFQAMVKKEKPFCYVDCHAGSGQYDLDSIESQKTTEFTSGISRLWQSREKLSLPMLEYYFAAISSINEGGLLRFYPGSPKFSQYWLRENDKALLLELHPQAYADLSRTLYNDKRLSLHNRDCYEGLPALLPPVIKRGIVLLDPSYEVKDEYRRILRLLKAAQKRWMTGVYVVWYPLLPAKRHLDLVRGLVSFVSGNVLISEMIMHEMDTTVGMYGSGMAIINPPWQLDSSLDEIVPIIANALSPKYGRAELRWLRNEA